MFRDPGENSDKKKRISSGRKQISKSLPKILRDFMPANNRPCILLKPWSEWNRVFVL